jgi:hypothetical protein
MGQRSGTESERSHGRLITTAWQMHGAAGFTNLPVIKEDGINRAQPALRELLRTAVG